MKEQIPCKYCHQYFKDTDEIVFITSKKFIKRKQSWLSGYKSKTLKKYHRRCWDKIEKEIETIENG